MKKENKQNFMRLVSNDTNLELENGFIKWTKSWFTLVELIVVITILAILATIGFVSFSWYLAWTRDTNRIAQLKSMSDALELYRTKKDLPIPDDKVDVKTNSEIIAYQGYIWKNVLETIEYTESWLDPKDKTYFSYYLTKNKKYFQLLAFLEESNTDVVALNSFNKTNAEDYLGRYPFVKWKKLWILVWTWTNTPIQEIEVITGSWYINIETANDTYKAILENGYDLIWTWSTLKMLAWTAWAWWVRNSCKIILEKNTKFRNKNWYYLINQEAPTKVYCDMTTNGWGWTRYVDIRWNYSFDDAKKCWLSKSNWTNWSWTIECFNPNRLNFIVSEYMVKQNTQDDWNWTWNKWTKKFSNNYPSEINRTSQGKRRCRWWTEYMTVMRQYEYPDNDLSNIDITDETKTYFWLGLNFCNSDIFDWELWGFNAADTMFMNYSTFWYWPIPWDWDFRENRVRPTQIFVK